MPAAENTGAGAGGAEVITQVTSGDDAIPPYPTSWSSDEYNKTTFPTDATPKPVGRVRIRIHVSAFQWTDLDYDLAVL